jgi:galactonate dehydratase
MKITKVKPYIIGVPFPMQGGNEFYFIKIETDEGFYGWGEMAFISAYHGKAKSLAQDIAELADKFLIGRNPLQRTYIWNNIYQHNFLHHGDLLRMALLSGIDIALWDIAGKVTGMPLYDLLGGRYRDKIRSYSYVYDRQENIENGTYTDWWKVWHDPEFCARRAAEMMEEGFTALKFDPLPARNSGEYDGVLAGWQLTLNQLDNAESIIREVRNAVGNNCDILIGTHGQTNTSAAIRFARRIEKYEPLWFEEPVPPENCSEINKVALQTTTPIATGERLAGAHEFHRLLSAGGTAIIQPDISSCGGVSEMIRIAALAAPYYVDVAPHIWGGPVATAVSLQIDTVIPNFLIQESIYTSNGFFDRLVKKPLHWEKGYFYVDDTAGIGIDLDESILRRYCLNEVL